MVYVDLTTWLEENMNLYGSLHRCPRGSFGWIRLVVVPLPGFSIRVANSVGEKPCNLEN